MGSVLTFFVRQFSWVDRWQTRRNLEDSWHNVVFQKYCQVHITAKIEENIFLVRQERNPRGNHSTIANNSIVN